MSRFRSLLFLSMADRRPLSIGIAIGISEQSTLLCEQKIVIQSSDFPVRRTGSYRHKKALSVVELYCRI